MVAKRGVYIRIGSRCAGFILPDEREMYKTFLNQIKKEERTHGGNIRHRPVRPSKINAEISK